MYVYIYTYTYIYMYNTYVTSNNINFSHRSIHATCVMHIYIHKKHVMCNVM